MIPNYDPREDWLNETWTLDSSDLFERFGFSDGSLFEELSLAEQMVMPNQQEILKIVVEQLLLPKLECKVELYEANTSHNRVRLDDRYQGQFKRVEITVTGKQVFDLLDELGV